MITEDGIDMNATYQITTGKGQGRIGTPVEGRQGEIYLFDGTANSQAVPRGTFHERTKLVEPAKE